MSSFKHQNRDEISSPYRSRGIALWNYEERGKGRFYFRLTPLAWILIVIPAILAMVLLATLYVYNTRTPTPKPDVTIKPRDTSTDPPPGNLTKRAPPAPTPPRVRVRSNANAASPAAGPHLGSNNNDQ